jgi:hypothetical protein
MLKYHKITQNYKLAVNRGAAAYRGKEGSECGRGHGGQKSRAGALCRWPRRAAGPCASHLREPPRCVRLPRIMRSPRKHILKNLIYPPCLSIGLRMVSQTVNQMRPQVNMQLLPEASYKLGTSIKNDGLRHTT